MLEVEPGRRIALPPAPDDAMRFFKLKKGEASESPEYFPNPEQYESVIRLRWRKWGVTVTCRELGGDWIVTHVHFRRGTRDWCDYQRPTVGDLRSLLFLMPNDLIVHSVDDYTTGTDVSGCWFSLAEKK